MLKNGFFAESGIPAVDMWTDAAEAGNLGGNPLEVVPDVVACVTIVWK